MSKRRDRPGEPPPEPRAHDGDRYEHTDVGYRPLIVFMIAVLLALGVVSVVVGGFGFLLYARRQATVRPPSVLYKEQPLLPTGPRLQSSPQADMRRMAAEERSMLNSYGWVDRKGGLVRIPVERAMEKIARHGLPSKRHDIPTTAGAPPLTTTTARMTGPVR